MEQTKSVLPQIECDSIFEPSVSVKVGVVGSRVGVSGDDLSGGVVLSQTVEDDLVIELNTPVLGH